MTDPVVLLILDGWGIAPESKGNAIAIEKPANIKALSEKYLSAKIEAAGEAVGLPAGEDGNSEVGHLNIGAGRIVLQSMPKINMAIVDGSFFENEAFMKAVAHVKTNNSDLHLLGLIGSGGVHAYDDHLYALIQMAKKNGIERLYLHLITDGRDSPPTEAKVQITRLISELKTIGVGQIASIMGRYYAMDRDLRWERIEQAYDVLVDSQEKAVFDPLAALENSYENHLTDEFIKPIPIGSDVDKSRIKDNDAVIFYNFRLDRVRELTRALVLPDFEKRHWDIKGFDPFGTKYHATHYHEEKGAAPFQRKKILDNLLMVTMTEYEKDLPVEVAFHPETFQNTLGQVVADNGMKQLRLAESEKERFVTFYFNGRREMEFENEDRLIIQSPQVATYDLKPEMSTPEISAAAVQNIGEKKYQFYVINIACPDMVAHSGNIIATKEAVLAADKAVGEIFAAVKVANGVLVITADHGNAEELLNLESGQMDTEHSINPVPLIIASDKLEQYQTLSSGLLADVAPTILKIMGITPPQEMTGRALI